MQETTSPQLKSGILTTEFWMTLGTSITGILVAIGILTPAEADEFVQGLMSVVGGLLTLSVMVVYISGRINLKRDQMLIGNQSPTLLEGIPDATSSSDSPTYAK